MVTSAVARRLALGRGTDAAGEACTIPRVGPLPVACVGYHRGGAGILAVRDASGVSEAVELRTDPPREVVAVRVPVVTAIAVLRGW